MKVVVYYTTNTPYEQEVQEFIKTAEKFETDYKVYAVSSENDWFKNCALKPKIIKRALEELQEDVLYLDSDARILRTLPLIESNVPGFCVWDAPWRPQELLSGTIYFPNTQLSHEIIDEWIEAQNNPNWKEILHQRKLEKIVKDKAHIKLDHDWVNIAGKRPGSYMLKTENPIILHTQASRRHRNAI